MKTTAQKRKAAREARAADPYAYQRSQEAKERKAKKPKKKDERPEILKNCANGAVARMKLYLQQWPNQMDHDRDLVLLDIHRMLRELTA